MSVAGLLPLPVVLPIGGAVLGPLVIKRWRLPGMLLAVAAVVGAVVVLVAVAARVYAGDGHIAVHYFGGERPHAGHELGITFAADPFGTFFALLTGVVGLLLLIALLVELAGAGARELSGLTALTLLLIAALIGAALTADTVNLFVWFEVAALASYGLTGFFLEQPAALEATFKALVITSIGGFVVFTGSAMLYTQDGALNFGQLHGVLAGHLGRPELVALGLLVGGYATKAGLAPFHGWLPDAHAQGPTAVPALFSALMVDLGVVAIVRLTLQVYGPDSGHRLLGLLVGLGVVSALLGAGMALAQDDLKRLLAWDTVSQVGVMILGFATATPEGVAGATLQMLAHGLFKALLFVAAGAVVNATGRNRLSQLGGLARRKPLLAGCFTLGALAIAGTPGFAAYPSLGLVHDSLTDQPAVLALAVLAQVLTVAAVARAAWFVFYRRPQERYEQLQPTRVGMRAVLVTLAALCIAVGALPYWLLHHVVGPAASGLLDASAYGHAVLHGGGALAPIRVAFSYGKGGDLLLAGGEIVLGLGLAAVYVRVREPRPVTWLRRLHTGSVNDYATFAAVGIVLAAGILLG